MCVVGLLSCGVFDRAFPDQMATSKSRYRCGFVAWRLGSATDLWTLGRHILRCLLLSRLAHVIVIDDLLAQSLCGAFGPVVSFASLFLFSFLVCSNRANVSFTQLPNLHAC